MAKPTHHSVLESVGFKLADQAFNGSSDRVGVATTHHYVMTRNSVGGEAVRPITHHVYVDEFGKRPGKYNVSYRVTQDGQQYSDGDFDTLRRHRDNAHRGVEDPIGEIVTHHHRVSNALDQQQPPQFEDLTRDNIHRLTPGTHHVTPGWGVDDPMMKSPRYILTGPEYQMQSLSAAEDKPLDSEVYRRLTSEHGNGPRFFYHGRFPGDEGTDLYQVSHPDPESPHTFVYGFTVRHRPELERPFSYNAMRYQSGVDDDGQEDAGSFLDVTGNMDHVANFGTLPQLVRRHQEMLAALGISSKGSRTKTSSDEFDEIIRGNKYAGSCAMCGKAVRDIPESSFRDDKLYQVNPEDENPDMHGPPVNLCGSCSVDPDVITALKTPSNRKSFGWHWNDEGVPGCPECEDRGWESDSDAFRHRAAHLMDQADEDLRP